MSRDLLYNTVPIANYPTHAKLLQSCPALCYPTDCSLPGFSVHGILQARILEWVATLLPRGSSWPRDWTHVSYISCIGRQVLYTSVIWEKPIKEVDFTLSVLFTIKKLQIYSKKIRDKTQKKKNKIKQQNRLSQLERKVIEGRLIVQIQQRSQGELDTEGIFKMPPTIRKSLVHFRKAVPLMWSEEKPHWEGRALH